MILWLFFGCGPSSIETDGVDSDSGSEVVGHWSEVSTAPCAKWSTNQQIYCWFDRSFFESRRDATRIVVSPPVLAWHAKEHDVAIGVEASTQRTTMWHCATIPALEWRCDPAEITFSSLTEEHGITPNFEYRRLYSLVERIPGVRSGEGQYIQIAEGNGISLLSTSNELFHANSAQVFVPHIPFEREVLKIASAGNGICALDTDGVIECFGPEKDPELPDPVRFDNPPYRDIASGFWNVCAVREDWVIECNDGSEHDFGPIRALDVHTYHYPTPPSVGLDPAGWVQPSPRDGLAVCVITEDDRIRCNGKRYPPGFEAKLDGDWHPE